MGQTEFRPREYYLPDRPYRLLPFQFVQFDAGRKIVVNEVGEHLFLGDEEFDAFVSHRLDRGSDVYLDLKGKHFLFDSDSTAPLELLAIKYRTKKAHLSGFTKLHIFVVSLRCEHSCHYCHVSRVSADKALYDMSPQTATRALDMVFRSPAKEVKIEFQGGVIPATPPSIRCRCSDRSNFGEPLDCVLVVPADGGFPCGRRLRGDVARAVVETGGVVRQH